MYRGKLPGGRKGGWLYWTAAILLVMAFIAVWGGFREEKSGTGGPGNLGSGIEDHQISVVTTIFPYYDFVRQVAGDKVKLKLIVPAGMDSHSFEPTPADMIAIESADLLICNGGEMEQWVAQVLDSLDTRNMKILTMMDYVDVVEEEHVEGMEDSDHGHEDSEPDIEHELESGGHLLSFDREDGHELDIEYDEHIWTSPVNAQAIVSIISQTLCQAAPENQDYFQAKSQAYMKELQALDADFQTIVSRGRHRMIVVADKFPFRYFAREYGLSYRAAFSGCSTDTEPSAKTIAYLIDRVREAQIEAVYYLELSSHRTAEIIGEETGAAPLLLHSCHNVTRKQFDEGVTYLQLMRGNAENLRKGLE